MKVRIERGIENGEKFISIAYLDGNTWVPTQEAYRETSDAITGAKSKLLYFGIFEEDKQEVEFEKGDFSKKFKFNKLNLKKDSFAKIKKEISERVKIVREWVKSLDLKESIEFEVDNI